MSSGGQAFGGVVGAVAGLFLGGPTGALYGAQIGLTIGGLIDPPKGPTVNGPRLDDLSVQTSTYGAVIPRVYGTVTVNGNVFWLENNRLKETVTKKKSGGKGGGSKTTTRTYTYSATFAVGLCKGPIVGVRRIWIGPDLIYDAGSSDPNTIAASNAAASGFRLYTGTDTQAADARMQATLGVPNTPAWRGIAYLVFYDLALAKYANSLMGAQIKAEVMMAAAPIAWTATQFALSASDSWGSMAASPTTAIAVAGESLSSNRIAITHDGQTWTEVTTSTSESRYCAAYGAGIFLIMNSGYGCEKSVTDGSSWTHIVSNVGQNWAANPVNAYPPYSGSSYSGICYGGGRFVATVSGLYCGMTQDGVDWRRGTMPASRSWGPVAHNGSVFCALAGGTNYCARSSDGLSWTEHTMAGSGNWNAIAFGAGLFVAVGFSGGVAIQSSPDGITWTTRSIGSLNFKGLVWNGDHFLAVGYGSNQAYASLDGISWVAVTLPATTTWRSCVPFMGAVVATALNTSIAAYIYVSRIGAGQMLSTVVSAECLQSGLLSAGDIDVSALTSSVRGYRIGSVGTLRSALEPLQASWPFDVVQRGYKLTFKPRGGASVATIAAGDFDARGASQEPGVQITQAREVDSQLPRRLTVRYLDSAREYDAGSQYAERLSSSTIRETVVDLPIVLDAAEAAGKAEVLLYAAWLARLQISFNLPATYLHLEPADVVTLPTPEGSITVRLTTVNYTSDNRVECRATLERAAVYTPAALGVVPSTTGPTTLTPLGPSTYALLDLPRLGSSQDGVGFPVAMCGADSAWPGGALMRSADAGATWDQPLDFAPPGATIGVATTTIGVVESRLIDAASRLTVTLTSGTLSDVSELAMLAGANHFAYGAAGRWEIIAARSCTLQSGSTYVLSNLLRGRFGSEWAMGLHATSDVVVLLDSADLQVLPLTNADIGAARLFRAITSGRDFSTDSDRAMTYAAVNLKPLSPVLLNGSRDPGTADWSLTWTRRTRKGGEWLDGVDAELGEAAEAYDIEVYADGSYATLKRTITASSPSCAYSSVDQVTDFGTNQSTLYLKVYQRSATVGRGYPLTTAITR